MVGRFWILLSLFICLISLACTKLNESAISSTVFLEKNLQVNLVREDQRLPISVSKAEVTDTETAFSLSVIGLESDEYSLRCSFFVPALQSSQTCEITFIPDEIYQGPRQFSLRLNDDPSSTLNYTLYDHKIPFLTVPTLVREGDILNGLMDAAVEAALEISIETRNITGVAGVNFQRQSPTLTVSTQGTRGLPISILNDGQFHEDLTFEIKQSVLEPVTGEILERTDVVIIRDRTTITATANAVTCVESVGLCTTQIQLSPPNPTKQHIQVFGLPGTAKDKGVDFNYFGAVYEVDPFQTTIEVSIPIVQDTLIELTESFSLDVRGIEFDLNPLSPVQISITDDDPLPTLALTQLSHAMAEGGSVTVNWTLSAPLEYEAQFKILSQAIQGTKSGLDLTYPAVIQIPSGVTSGNFLVTAAADEISDSLATEKFRLNLLSSSPSLLHGTSFVELDVTDGDPAPILSIFVLDAAQAVPVEKTTHTIREDKKQVKVRVKSYPRSELALNFNLQTKDGPAPEGANVGAPIATGGPTIDVDAAPDYQSLNLNLSLAPMTFSFESTVNINPSDISCEDTEYFHVALASSFGNGAAEIGLLESSPVELSIDLAGTEMKEVSQEGQELTLEQADYYYSGPAFEDTTQDITLKLDRACAKPIKIATEDVTEENFIKNLIVYPTDPSAYSFPKTFTIPANSLTATYQLSLLPRVLYQTPTSFSLVFTIDETLATDANTYQVRLNKFLKKEDQPESPYLSYQGRLLFNLSDTRDEKPILRLVKNSVTSTGKGIHETLLAAPATQTEQFVQGEYQISVELDRRFEGKLTASLAIETNLEAGRDYTVSSNRFTFTDSPVNAMGPPPGILLISLFDNEADDIDRHIRVLAQVGSNNGADSSSVFQFAIKDDDDLSQNLMSPLSFSDPDQLSGWVAAKTEGIRTTIDGKRSTGLSIIRRDGSSFRQLSVPSSNQMNYVFRNQFYKFESSTGNLSRYLFWSEGSFDPDKRPLAGSRISFVQAQNTLGTPQTAVQLSTNRGVLDKFDLTDDGTLLLYRSSILKNGLLFPQEARKIDFPTTGARSSTITCPGDGQAAQEFEIIDTNQIAIACGNQIYRAQLPNLNQPQEVITLEARILKLEKFISPNLAALIVTSYCDAQMRTLCLTILYDVLSHSPARSMSQTFSGEYNISVTTGRLFTKGLLNRIPQLYTIYLNQATNNFTRIPQSEGLNGTFYLGRTGVYFSTVGPDLSTWLKYANYNNLSGNPIKIGGNSCANISDCSPSQQTYFSFRKNFGGSEDAVLYGVKPSPKAEFRLVQGLSSNLTIWTDVAKPPLTLDSLDSPIFGFNNFIFAINLAGKFVQLDLTFGHHVDACPSFPSYLAERVYSDPKDSSVIWVTAKRINPSLPSGVRWMRRSANTCQRFSE